MKKILMWVLFLTLVLTTTGCGAKKKLEQKVGEALTEKLIESATNSKVDIKGDKITIKDEQGQEATLGGNEWPKSDLIKNIPEFKNGTIVSVMDSSDYILMIIENVSKNDFAKYLETIKSDFTEGALEMATEDVTSYMAGNNKGVGVQISYTQGDGNLSINVTQVPQE